ncbi:hypothetical protein DMUE_4836 [Dictyocoela muelleri]|nr:hypothetical protein DMUE_4836 [Dictyocoela muelleri]
MLNNRNKTKRCCSYHNTTSHDSSECRAIKKRHESKNKDVAETRKTYAVTEPRVNPKTIKIPLEVNGKKFERLIDTESSENYISEGAAKYANVNPIKLPIKKVTEVGNGELVDISEEARVKF